MRVLFELSPHWIRCPGGER